MKRKILLLNVIVLFNLLFISCSDDDKTSDLKKQFGIFKIMNDEVTVIMNGEINSKSLNNFNDLLKNYPKINQINIIECGGSSDDEVNLELSLKVHKQNIRTHINDNGMVASGGTDFFLAGVKRTIGNNIRIGVHSWAGEESGGKKISATDFPKGHKNHLPYIRYYTNVGFTQEQAETFYYFTINAASAESMHWMTKEEIKKYHILKE